MGDAKRRKSNDPSYGKPKRGLVLSSNIKIDGQQVSVTGGLDLQELRFALLFWDKLVWTSPKIFGTLPTPEYNYLENSGIMEKKEYLIPGLQHIQIPVGHTNVFLELDRAEPGVWSMCEGENSVLVKSNSVTPDGGVYILLYNAISVPDIEVPLEDIIEFKRRRYDELLALRSEVDNFYSKIEQSGDVGAIDSAVVSIDQACRDAIRVSREIKFPLRLVNLKASLDLKPLNTVAGFWAGKTLGDTFHMPLATGVLGAVAASIKIGGDFGFQRIRPRQGPYRYVARYHNELFFT